MSEFRKYAVFHLAVVGLTVIVFAVLFGVTQNGRISQAAFATLSLLGFGQMYFQRRGRSPIYDERDAEINRRAATIGYAAFWVVFVLWSVFLSLRYGAAGTVPVVFIEPAVWVGVMLVVGVRAGVVLTLSRVPSP